MEKDWLTTIVTIETAAAFKNPEEIVTLLREILIDVPDRPMKGAELAAAAVNLLTKATVLHPKNTHAN